MLVVPGSRGAAAAALTLDYHVDDSPQNAVDVVSESSARVLEFFVSTAPTQMEDGALHGEVTPA